ncbi:MAG: methionine biosynthesis protein MetW [Planctomycetaceae bacterium]
MTTSALQSCLETPSRNDAVAVHLQPDTNVNCAADASESGVERYYAHCRNDILAEVPAAARNILSIGCGAGATEGELVRAGARVVGIEMNPSAAAAARRRGLVVIEGDAGAASAKLADERFDCLIYADILEHLTDPVAVLQSHVGLLEPGGTVIISVPNFRYHAVARDLFLKGHVRYTDSGIFDRTHVRMTTCRMVEEWLGLVGLVRTGLNYRIAMRRERMLNAVSLGVLREFLARQVIVVATKEDRSRRCVMPSADAATSFEDAVRAVRHAR